MRASIGELMDKIERVSTLYAERCGIRRDDDWYALKLQEELGELVAEYARLTGRGRTKGKSEAEIRDALNEEAADLFAHLLLFCHHHGLDLESALERKWFRYLQDNEDRGGADGT